MTYKTAQDIQASGYTKGSTDAVPKLKRPIVVCQIPATIRYIRMEQEPQLFLVLIAITI
jgi:hypothetical protein